ncbi:MAG: hypothetical protein HYX26_09190 [Acidobacteriales bacterium]|nr:hypothetical protein [Terriglobales bacterium]
MTIQQIDELIEDTRRLPRAADKVTWATALGVLEVARQLVLLNENLTFGVGGNGAKPKASAKKSGTRKKK